MVGLLDFLQIIKEYLCEHVIYLRKACDAQLDKLSANTTVIDATNIARF